MAVRRPLVAAAAVALAGTILLVYLVSKPEPLPVAADPAAPNIVVIMTDDQNAGTINRRTMPFTTEFLKRRGVNFTDNIVTTPQCCPSRSSYLTGQYGHNNGVLSNDDGYPSLLDAQSVLPAWLNQAGYNTAHVGRWLHDYGKADDVGSAQDPAPGWDEWAGMQGVKYFDYGVSFNGFVGQFGHRPRDYSDTVLTRQAVTLVHDVVPTGSPMFLNVAYVAPHKQRGFRAGSYCDRTIAPAPRDRHRFRHAPLPSNASVDERDISDKPFFIQNGQHLDQRYAKTLRAYRCGLASLREVDRGVQRIYEAFRQVGEAGNTVFIFTSDNGRFQGEHQLPGGKSFPYETAIRVPLMIRMPARLSGGASKHRTNALTANIDLAPTILDLARALPCVGGNCRLMDGRSLLPLLTSRNQLWPHDRAVLVELREPPQPGEARLPCAYEGVRTRTDFYVDYTEVRLPTQRTCLPADIAEYYNLAKDPEELHNLAGLSRHAQHQRELAQLVDTLQNCAGLPGRIPPSSTPFCDATLPVPSATP